MLAEGEKYREINGFGVMEKENRSFLMVKKINV